jgi:hypothetical protein
VHGRAITGWRRQSSSVSASGCCSGLQFALAGDIVRTAISPTWEEIGQLAAIAAIRTFLNYFLEKDLAEADKSVGAAGVGLSEFRGSAISGAGLSHVVHSPSRQQLFRRASKTSRRQDAKGPRARPEAAPMWNGRAGARSAPIWLASTAVALPFSARHLGALAF